MVDTIDDINIEVHDANLITLSLTGDFSSTFENYLNNHDQMTIHLQISDTLLSDLLNEARRVTNG